MTIESYQEAVRRIAPKALLLKECGATAILIMGTSLCLLQGRRLQSGIIGYNCFHVNATLERFLKESGFEIVAMEGLNLTNATGRVTQDHLYDFSAGVFAKALNADTFLISCGGLKTIDLLGPLEAKRKVAVVSNTPHALMNAVRLTGLNPRATGYGRVLAKAQHAGDFHRRSSEWLRAP